MILVPPEAQLTPLASGAVTTSALLALGAGLEDPPPPHAVSVAKSNPILSLVSGLIAIATSDEFQ
jgi:hypothetical protein